MFMYISMWYKILYIQPPFPIRAMKVCKRERMQAIYKSLVYKNNRFRISSDKSVLKNPCIWRIAQITFLLT